MAGETGFGFGVDIGEFEAAIDRADKKLKKLAETGQKTANAINEAFRQASEGGVNHLLERLKSVNGALEAIKSNGGSSIIGEIGKGASDVANNINAVATAVENVNTKTKQKFSNNAIVQLNAQIEESKQKLSTYIARLGELNEKLQFYAKGEGQKAAGAFFDTSAYEAEAKKLMQIISQLNAEIDQMNKKKASLYANAPRRYASGVEQENLDNEWYAMEREKREQLKETARVANETAKANIKAFDDAYIAYEQMFDELIKKENERILLVNQRAKEESEIYKRTYDERRSFYENWISAEYAKENERYAQQNASAKQKSIQAKQSYEEQTRAYERMFDEIDAKEKQRAEAEKKRKDKEVEDAKKAAEKKAEAERKELEKNLKHQAELQAKYDSKSRKENYKAYTTSYEGALRTSDRAKNMLQDQQAIRNLEAARAKLSRTDADYEKKLATLNQRIKQHEKNIKKAKGESDGLRESHSNLMDISGQLARRLALVFSVSQIVGYMRKLVEVRGEFELQQKALQAIVQNVEEANKLWEKTVALAVKSPFRVKELVTYTKQLAAYRVETDKLYDTTKMLADVSAGLGVDMQRLILAYGQVKAANYLRGTELRQFSEAGINILGELATYFTELEGRAVSVGDVFERVSRRMVTFADVEEIFKRITGEGGTFYNMQELQAETMKGMWSNLQDSIDIMLNDVGKKNETTIKRYISYARQMVEGWRNLVPYIETAGISFLTYFGVDVLRKVIRAFKTLWATASAHPLLAILSIVGLVATAIWRAVRAQNAFNAAMSEVDNEILKSLEQSISLYHKLAETINDATKSNEERNRALDNLKTKFQDILPDQYLELEYIKQLGNNYRDAEQAMTNYYNAKAQEQKKDRVEGMYAKELEGTDIPELITSVKSRISTRLDIKESMKPILLSGVSGVINSVVQDIKSGALANDFDAISDEIQKRLERYADVELPRTQAGEGIFRLHDVKDIVETLGEYKDALENIQGLPYETHGQKVASEWLNKEKESLREISNIYKKLLSLYSKYSKATDEDKVDIADDISLAMSQVPEKLNDYLPLLQESVDKMKGIAEKGAFEFTASMQTLESDFVEGLVRIVKNSRIDNMWLDPKMDLIMLLEISKNLQEEIKKASHKLDMTPFQNAVVGGARQIAERFGQDVNIFEKFIPNQKESLSNIRQEVKSQIESYESQILEMQTSLTQGMYVLSEEVLNNTKESIESMTNQLPALRAFLAFLGEMEKDKGRKDNTIEERIKVVDQMNKKYKELKKTLSEGESLEGAFEAYKDAFATAYGREDVRDMSVDDFIENEDLLNFASEDEIVVWLNKLAASVSKKADKVKVELAIGKFEMEEKERAKKKLDETLEKEIQELFDRYDLSLELKKLNIPSSLAKSLFDVDYLDLEGLKKAVQDQEAKFIGTDMEDEYEKFLQKIKDLSKKEREEEAKEFINFLKGHLEEIKLVQDTEAYNISLGDKLFDEGKITGEQYLSAIGRIISSTNDEISRLNLKAFKESPQYIQAMGNLSTYTAKEIKALIDELNEMIAANKGAFSADEAEAYINALYKAQEKLDELEKSPFRWETFANISDILETEGKIKTAKKDKNDLLEKESSLLNTLKEQEEDLLNLERQRNNATDEATKQTIQSQIDQKREAIKSSNEDIEITQGNIAKMDVILGNLGNKLQGLTGGGSSAAGVVAIIDAIINGINDTVQGILELTREIGSVMESFGKETDMSTGFGKFEKGFSIFAESSQHAADGWNSLKEGDPVGTAISIVKSVTSIIKGINSYIDADLQVQIDDNLEKIETLQKEYKKLEKSVEDAYSIEQLNKANKELEKNIELQKKSYAAMIAAEKDKKDSDEDQIKAWTEELEELTEQAEELNKSILDGLGGVTDFRAQTRGFVDAWVSAFHETGDGLSGLQDNFKEFFDNIIKEQATLRVVDKYLADFYDMVNDSLDDDMRLTQEESEELRKEADRIMPLLNEALEMIWKGLGGSTGESGTGLTALQKGIQGLTEQQGEVIESYLNSIRMYVATISADTTSQLNEVKAIHNLLNSLTRGGHKLGGVGLKVFMD